MNNDIFRAKGTFALSDEERLLISRAEELSSRPRGSAVASCFLTPREIRLVHEGAKTSNCFFFGGAVGCTRRKLIFLPDWADTGIPRAQSPFDVNVEREWLEAVENWGISDMTEELISTLRIKMSGYEQVSHRDILGALMALGIKRETLGDICFFGDSAYVFCEPKTANFLAGELQRAGRDKVRCEIAPLPDGFEMIQQFEEIHTTVASPRLDGIVRALCNISREDAAELVERGNIEVNYFPEENVDAKIADGDIISVRGYGKFAIDSLGELTRRGRVRLEAKKYN